MFDLNVKIQRTFRPIMLFTSLVRTNIGSINLLRGSSIMLLPPVSLFFIEFFIILIIVGFEFDDLLKNLISFFAEL